MREDTEKGETPSLHITQGRPGAGRRATPSSPSRAPSSSPTEFQAHLHAHHTNDMGGLVQGQVDEALVGHGTALQPSALTQHNNRNQPPSTLLPAPLIGSGPLQAAPC